ncbi:hypothetical protein COSO111634_01875 [Corallococcus soli]
MSVSGDTPRNAPSTNTCAGTGWVRTDSEASAPSSCALRSFSTNATASGGKKFGLNWARGSTASTERISSSAALFSPLASCDAAFITRARLRSANARDRSDCS